MVDWQKQRAEWDKRVALFGQRAVFNYGHPESELAAITEKQREVILPLFQSQLLGNELVTLDFGCGWGRWSETLADITKGMVVGIDPTSWFIDKAIENNTNKSVVFDVYSDGKIPLENAQYRWSHVSH